MAVAACARRVYAVWRSRGSRAPRRRAVGFQLPPRTAVLCDIRVYALRRTAGGVTRAHGSRHTTTLYTFSTLGGSEQGEKGAFKRNAKGASPARNRASRGRYDYCKVVGCQ